MPGWITVVRQRFYCSTHAGTCTRCRDWKKTDRMPEWPSQR